LETITGRYNGIPGIAATASNPRSAILRIAETASNPRSAILRIAATASNPRGYYIMMPYSWEAPVHLFENSVAVLFL